MTKHWRMLAAMAVTLSTGAMAQQNWKPVSVEEMKKEIVGKVMAVTLANKSEATWQLRADGRAEFRGSGSFDGTWRTSAKGYCTIYPNLRGGAETCYEIIRLADGSFETYDDKGQYQGRMRPK